MVVIAETFKFDDLAVQKGKRVYFRPQTSGTAKDHAAFKPGAPVQFHLNGKQIVFKDADGKEHTQSAVTE